MKHRSLGIFIILAASLAAIPQASQELAALRDAVGERARIELWSAFLELQSGGARPAAAAPAPAAIASCETPREESTGATAKAATPQSEESRREVKEQPRRAESTETARIIVDPSDAPRLNAKADGDWSEKSAAALRRALRRNPAGEPRGAEYAMFVPPGEAIEIDADAFAPALSQLGRNKGGWLRHGEVAELQRHAAFDAARERELVRRGQREAERSREEIRRRVQNGAQKKGGVEGQGVEHFLKVFKVKASEKIGPPAPVAVAPRPALTFYAAAPAPSAETE